MSSERLKKTNGNLYSPRAQEPIHSGAKKPLVPQLTQEWKDSIRVAGTGEDFLSDFCMIQDKADRWHCIGIGGQGHIEDSFFHAIGDKVTEPYAYTKRVESNHPDMHHMWAPYAVYKDENTAWLYYAHCDLNMDFSIRILESVGNFDEWYPLKSPELEQGNILFREKSARDPVIFWEEKLAAFVMYYCALDPSFIQCRTSVDLLHWTDPKTVMTIPQDYMAAESPFVYRKDGYYYLFVSGFDYGRISVYVSENPFDFGDPVKDRLVEISGHAAEIVTIDGLDYILCAAISSTLGNQPGAHDLFGVFAQKLIWVEAKDAKSL